MTQQFEATMSPNGVLHTLKFGRMYFLGQLRARLAKRYLSMLSGRLLKRGNYQVATFAFDHIGHHINLRGVFELEELTSVMGWLSEKGLVRGNALDIGSNIGNHALFFSRYYQRVYGFEPNRKTFQLLKYNASLVNNVECFNIGLSSHDGKAVLAIDPANVGASRVASAPASGDTNERQEIELMKLDSLSHIIANPIGLIKIDVEGHELEVLKGGKETIDKYKPLILFEQHPGDFTGGKSEVVEYLKSVGYGKFATVMPWPYVGIQVPGIIRNPLITALRLLFGLHYRIVLKDVLEPGFYAFVIAVPDVS